MLQGEWEASHREDAGRIDARGDDQTIEGKSTLSGSDPPQAACAEVKRGQLARVEDPGPRSGGIVQESPGDLHRIKVAINR
jgi:hypothetical protein